jgi:hypothetical protein
MAKTSLAAVATNARNGAAAGPTVAQRRILDAYFAKPNAAAVARELGVSERNVRRVCHRFSDELRERSRRRDAERVARADARQAKIEDWADRVLDETLTRPNELAASENAGVAIRAIKLMLEIAMREVGRDAVFSFGPEFAAMRQAKEHELIQRLRALEADEASGHDGADR